MAEIALREVRKTYSGGFEAIRGVSVDIPDGEICVLVGPSGCGKSTLLRMVAGLETITAGEIVIGGRLVNELEPRERDIAMVFQNYALYPHMSVFGNMSYGLRIAGVPKADIRARVEEAARMLELDALLDRKPRHLSGGQRQRVAMGRAIVREPQAFLFDEPLSNLDAKLRSQMRVEVKALQRKLGVTSIYVTHDQVEAMTLADVMVVMNAGRAEQIGRPLAVYERPATIFVAGFIGSPPMNFLPGEDGQTLGIRPEHVTFVPATEAGLEGEVILAEPLGAETLVHVALAGGTRIIVRRDSSEIPATGTRLGLAWLPEHLHRFDAEGRRIG